MIIKLNDKRLYPTDSVEYLGVKIDSKLNWKSHVNAVATKLNQANAMLYKVRDFVNMQIFLNQYIMHYLNHTLTILASYGDKTSAQLTFSTFSRKRHIKLSISKRVMLTPLLYFITLKLLNILIINYL